MRLIPGVRLGERSLIVPVDYRGVVGAPEVACTVGARPAIALPRSVVGHPLIFFAESACNFAGGFGAPVAVGYVCHKERA